MFKPKLPKQEQGFTMVEVLIAILIATIFVAVTMQMMAIAAMFKVRAQEYAEATAWIQEDLEYVKYQAANDQYTSLVDEATGDSTHESIDTVLHLDSVDDFHAGDTVIVGAGSINHTIATGGVNTTAKTITLTTPLGTDRSTGTPVVVTTRCNPSSSTSPRFDVGLRDFITDTDHTNGITSISIASNPNDFDNPLRSKVFTNKTFRLRRTTTLASDSPYRVLTVSYDVSPTSSFGGAVSGASVASFYTEVIPNAALQCPK